MSKEDFNRLTHFEASQRLEIIARLELARQSVAKPNQVFNASWLHSDIFALVWRVSKTHVTRVVDGEVIGYREIDWNVLLHDGTRLGDPTHSKFLRNLQKIAFSFRENPNGFEPPNSETHPFFIGFLITLAKCVYLYQDELNPDEDLLSRVDSHFIEGYVKRYSEGGNSYILGYPQQFIVNLYQKVFNISPSIEVITEPLKMELSDRLAIQQWFESNNLISRVTRFELPYLETSVVNMIIGPHCEQFDRSVKFNKLLKFLIGDSTKLITPKRISTEFFSHKTPSVDDANKSATICSLQSVVSNWTRLMSMKKLFPNTLPNESAFNKAYLNKIANTFGSKSNHTPWIPLKTALTYTTECLRWVHVYGEDLVSLYLESYRFFYEKGLLSDEGHTPQEVIARRSFRNNYINSKIPTSLRYLNITGGMSRSLARGGTQEYGNYEIFRTSPSLADVMSILVGAVLILVGITKPIRQAEAANLGSDCVRFLEGDGYWLNQHFGKRNFRDKFEIGARPIPAITAKALLLIKRLSDGLKEIQATTDQYLLDRLFVFPNFGGDQREIKVQDKKVVSKYLDFFCDFVNLPPDELNRRWYVRVHELRKSFLIVFFWCFKFASLEASRWMANHASTVHIYAYIQANFPGEELPAIEAQYATKLMWDFESSNQTFEIENVEELHSHVCDHFGVTSISLISEDEFESWMEYLFQSGNCEIVPYKITSDDGTIDQKIAFKISGRS